MLDRRQLVGGAALATLLGGTVSARAVNGAAYGSVGRIKASLGQYAALAALVMGATGEMPGCRAYFVCEDLADPDALWVFEAWDSKAAHNALLTLPAVREAVARARPLIAQFDSGAELKVLNMAVRAG